MKTISVSSQFDETQNTKRDMNEQQTNVNTEIEIEIETEIETETETETEIETETKTEIKIEIDIMSEIATDVVEIAIEIETTAIGTKDKIVIENNTEIPTERTTTHTNQTTIIEPQT